MFSEKKLNKPKTNNLDNMHLIEEKIIRGTKINLIFFNPNDRKQWNTEYIDIIKNDKSIKSNLETLRYTIKLAKGIELKILKSAVNKQNQLDLTKERFMMTPSFRKFLEFYRLPIDIKQNDASVISILKTHEVFFKKTKTFVTVWNINKSIYKNNYVAVLLIDNKPFGICISEIIDDKELGDLVKEKEIPDINYNLYIARVDIHPEFQGFGLCKPLVSYMIKQLKILGYKFLFINNASHTNKGIPACICYIRAGTDSKYKLKYKDNKTNDFKDMDDAYCLSHTPIPKDYYYEL